MNLIFDFHSLFEPVPSHLLAEIIFALSLYFFQVSRFYFFLKHKYNGANFEIYYKNSTILARTATCKISFRNILKLKPIMEFSGKQIDKPQEGNFWGEFIFNPFSLKTGEGILYHSDDRFNFPKIIIRDKNTFFTETRYLAH